MKTVDLGKVRGNMIYSGGAVTGSSAAGVIFDATGIEKAYAGDIYINLDASGQYNGCIYECIKPGAPDAATWSYKGSIRGPKVPTVNNLKSTSTEDALAAYQGKRIMDMMIEAGVFGKTVIVDCDLTAYGVKMTIDNVDSTFKITVDGKEYTYNYTASGTVDKTTVSVVLGENIGMQKSGGVVSKITSSNAYIYSYKLTDSSMVEIYSKNTELWTVINELAQSHEVTGTVIDGEETLAMGPIHKFINGIKRMFYPITHAKAVWFNKTENKTVYDVVEELMNKNSAGVVSDEYDPVMIYGAGEYCIHENTLMKCTGSTTGTFDPAKWEACTVASELSEQNKKTVHQVENLVSISSGSIGIEKVGRVVTLYTNGLQLTNAINTATIIGKVPNDLKPSNTVINVSIHSVGGKSYPCRVALTTNGEIKVEAYDWDGGYLSTNLWMTMSMVWMI